MSSLRKWRALSLLLLVGCGGGGTKLGVASASGPLPELKGTTLTGTSVSASTYSGKVTVVNFWASWCAPCRQEQPGLERLAKKYAGRVAFVGIDFRDDADSGRAYLKEFAVTYPSLEDPTGDIAFRFGIPGIPATVVADQSGTMRNRILGVSKESDVERLIQGLLRP